MVVDIFRFVAALTFETPILLQTCKNFSELAKRGYYNNVIFHRVIQVSEQRVFHRSLLAGVPHLFFAGSPCDRTLWCKEVIQQVPVEEELQSMGKSCEWFKDQLPCMT